MIESGPLLLSASPQARQNGTFTHPFNYTQSTNSQNQSIRLFIPNQSRSLGGRPAGGHRRHVPAAVGQGGAAARVRAQAGESVREEAEACSGTAPRPPPLSTRTSSHLSLTFLSHSITTTVVVHRPGPPGAARLRAAPPPELALPPPPIPLAPPAAVGPDGHDGTGTWICVCACV